MGLRILCWAVEEKTSSSDHIAYAYRQMFERFSEHSDNNVGRNRVPPLAEMNAAWVFRAQCHNGVDGLKVKLEAVKLST